MPHTLDIDRLRELESHLNELEGFRSLKQDNMHLEDLIDERDKRIALLESFLLELYALRGEDIQVQRIIKNAGL